MNKSTVSVLAALILCGCSKEPEQELLGRYYGNIKFKPGKDKTAEAKGSLEYMQQCAVFFYRPNKFMFETPSYSWSGTFKVDGDTATLTADQINGLSVNEAREHFLTEHIKNYKDPKQFKIFVDWVTNPIVLKIDSDGKTVHETLKEQEEEGDYYYEKRV